VGKLEGDGLLQRMDEVGTLALAGGIPNLAETIDLLVGGHALLGWKKICTYQLTCLTKIVGIWGEYISQCTWSSHTHLLAEACLTKKHTSVHLY